MTIKAYMTNGKIEEYPNAYITWEWDESEKGTDSGWRVNAMDKNYTTVSAFIYPKDCQKIEIIHEDCDKVFESKPYEGISGKRFRIFLEIDKERKRQDEKWGEQNHLMVRFSEHIDQNKKLADAMKVLNDSSGNYDWCSILLEEVYEAFSETELEKQREEMIQVAAVAVQIIEYLDRKTQDREKA